jgi:hypothetical protein
MSVTAQNMNTLYWVALVLSHLRNSHYTNWTHELMQAKKLRARSVKKISAPETLPGRIFFA